MTRACEFDGQYLLTLVALPGSHHLEHIGALLTRRWQEDIVREGGLIVTQHRILDKSFQKIGLDHIENFDHWLAQAFAGISCKCLERRLFQRTTQGRQEELWLHVLLSKRPKLDELDDGLWDFGAVADDRCAETVPLLIIS